MSPADLYEVELGGIYVLPLVTIVRSGEEWLLTKLALFSPNFRHSSTGIKHQNRFGAGAVSIMRVELKTPEFDVEPRTLVKNEPVLAMALRPGWVEVGPRRSEMKKISFEAGEMAMCDVWIGTHGLESLILTISDPALRAANDGISGDVELRVVYKLADSRLGALVAAVNAERVAGFPSGRLFLDSIEQALAVALVK